MSTLSVIKSTGCPPSTYYYFVEKLASGKGSEYLRAKWQTMVTALEAGTDYLTAKTLAGKRERKQVEPPCVYLLTCIGSGRAYVGQSTRGLKYREGIHRALRVRVRKCLSEGVGIEGFFTRYPEAGGSRILIAEIFAYPLESDWTMETLHTCPHGTLSEMRAVLTPLEIAEITSRGTLSPVGLNGNLGFNPTAEVRERLSAAGRGKPKTALHRERMSAAHKERWEARKAAEGVERFPD